MSFLNIFKNKYIFKNKFSAFLKGDKFSQDHQKYQKSAGFEHQEPTKPSEDTVDIVKLGKGEKKSAIFANVLTMPHITEKTTHFTGMSKYCFTVAQNVNKNQIRSAVHAIFNVNPIDVHIINQRGKAVRFGKVEGKRKNFKKAIITLTQGEKLDIFEGV